MNEESLTQHGLGENLACGTQEVGLSSQAEEAEEAQSIELWGVLRPKNSMAAQIKLSHRVQEGKRDTYTLGRSKSADVVVELSQVSGTHCYVYCDYESARLRVFVEDCSRLGTYVNSSLTRLRKGERLEIHSGDELFLVNPRQENSGEAAFLFVNMRERFFNQMQRIKEQRPPMGLHATVDDDDENGGSNATSDAEGDDGRDGRGMNTRSRRRTHRPVSAAVRSARRRRPVRALLVRRGV